ncbi:MAG: hypothetical protein JRD93_08970 [Deltaproteobacteria bacterium]|nr:hypothetical protein [Deltaproteobacteria bacterium]MBW2662101.1 hypothetical protein [Deltaproteobacteria bacterium]
MKKKSIRAARSYFSIVTLIITLVVGFSPTMAMAQLMTECCVDCHVVHTWEDQAERKKASDKAYASAIHGAGRAYTKQLLEETCERCHADANSHAFAKSGLNTVPIVKNAAEPENPLAGGNFYYSSGKLHFKKAGGSCTSCHRDVRHHGTDAGYRFLGPDIKGIGDPLYEHGEGHNIYQSGDQYCIACHADFCGSENQASDSGWVRHPTNTLLPMNGEYAGYEVYRKDIPVSYPDPKKPERSTARVMCLSCHRPHGTPNLYLLRWDYKTMVAGGGDKSTGCFACHATKDTEK